MLKLNLALDHAFFAARFGRCRYYVPLSAALGLSATLALAPFGQWLMMPLALTGLMTLQAFAVRARQVGLTCLLFLVAFNAASFDFVDFVMRDFGQLPAAVSCALVVLLAAWIAAPYALLQMAAFAASRGQLSVFVLLFSPAALCGGDLCAYHLFGGFPWNYAGYAAVHGPLSAYAPLAGVLGINVVIYVISAGLALAVMRRFVFLPVPAVLLALGTMLMGAEYTAPGPGHRAALVQAGIEQRLRWDESQVAAIISRHLELSQPWLAQEGMLVIWSESSLPVFREAVPTLMADLNALCQAQGSVLITGIQTREEGHAYNSLITLGLSADPADMQVYRKRQLVPFGETVPLREYLAPLSPIFNFPMSSFTPGPAGQPNTVIGDLRLINAICYEAVYSGLLRDGHRDDSGAIVMLSNDGWFGDSRGPLMHLDIARMRCLELQKPMLRVTGNGITAFINARGEVEQELPQGQAGVLEVSFETRRGSTPYARAGNVPALAAVAALLVAGLILRRRGPDPRHEAIARMVRP